MHPRVQAFADHIKGLEEATPPVLLLWRDDKYLGIWDLTPEGWAVDLVGLSPEDGVSLTKLLLSALVKETKATACLTYFPSPFFTFSYEDATHVESFRQGAPVKDHNFPFYLINSSEK